MGVAYIESSDDSGRVASDELHAHAEMAEQVGALGLEASAGVFVEDEVDLGAAIVVLDVVESPSGDVVSTEWDVHGLFGDGTQSGISDREEEEEGKVEIGGHFGSVVRKRGSGEGV